ncbi:MAG: GrpB family protein [Pyrinomonadaceae bacterium]
MKEKFVVVPHDPNWTSIFLTESEKLKPAFGNCLLAIHHIGSTAIAGIYAKPVIDMLAVVERIEIVDPCDEAIAGLGYEIKGEFGIPGRRYFRKDIGGVRTFQLHTFEKGSPQIDRHLAFRDYLNSHPEEAAAYSELKRNLILKHDGDPEKYMDGKDGFIREIDRKAASMASLNV